MGYFFYSIIVVIIELFSIRCGEYCIKSIKYVILVLGLGKEIVIGGWKMVIVLCNGEICGKIIVFSNLVNLKNLWYLLKKV